jgi:ElaB/YqjD/DUF883 family membrane-anchored ribosome-binding protein
MNNIQSKQDALQEKADCIRTKVADKLESAAHSIRASADEGASTLHDMADRAGKKLDGGAANVRNFARRKTIGGFRSRVRANPLRSIALATALGLIAGISWRAAR